MVTTNDVYEYEANSRRLANRYRGRLSILRNGHEVTVCNWSATGCLLDVHRLQPFETLELVIPCQDGNLILRVHFKIVRTDDEGRIGVKFIFDNPMDAASLAAHARNVEAKRPSYRAELLRAGRPVEMELQEQEKEDEPPQDGDGTPRPSRFRRYLPLAIVVVVSVVLAFIILPHVQSQFLMKLGEKKRYVLLAEKRLAAARVQLQSLERKYQNANDVFTRTPIQLTNEQKALFKLGMDQIQAAIELQNVNIQMLEANLQEVKRGNFFFEKEALGPFSTQKPEDTAPFLTELLAEIAAESRNYPRNATEALRYQQVAKLRYENAVAEFEANKVKLAAVNGFLKQYEPLVAKGALPRNTLVVLKRDRDLLLIEQERLRMTMALLEDNWKDTQDGNFMLETRLLEKFNPIGKPLGWTSVNLPGAR